MCSQHLQLGAGHAKRCAVACCIATARGGLGRHTLRGREHRMRDTVPVNRRSGADGLGLHARGAGSAGGAGVREEGEHAAP